MPPLPAGGAGTGPFQVTYSFISKAFEKDEGICRETFFSKDMPSASVRKCAGHALSSREPGRSCSARAEDWAPPGLSS